MIMKTLKFEEKLAKMVLSGEKNITWRFFDDKDLKEGDLVDFLVYETGNSFAKAKIINIKEKKLGELKPEDFEGHEKFKDENEMYETYRKYYGDIINSNSIIKIIKFKLI